MHLVEIPGDFIVVIFIVIQPQKNEAEGNR